MNKIKNELYNTIELSKTKSAWSKGVRIYALELLENLEEFTTIEQLEAHENGFEKIGISVGTCGTNGALLKGCNTGRLFVITARNSTLFRLI